MAARKKAVAKKRAVAAKKPAAGKPAPAKPAPKTAARPGAGPGVGDRAPDFTLPTDSGSVSLSALRGRPVVVYFYPKDDTPGCTREACGFNDSLPDFGAVKAEIIGISKDGAGSHGRFRQKYGLKFQLASDEDTAVQQAYGVWIEKSLYGRKYMGTDRATFLIDKDGVIRGAWRGVKVDGHVAAVLAAARAL